jgi:hypothetical protein
MGRRLACSTLAFLSILLWVATARPARAQQLPAPPGNEFILRAPADRVQAIATRHGLTVIRQLEGQDAFLVRNTALPLGALMPLGGQDSGSLQAVLTVVESDPDVVHFEQNALVVTPEVASGINLNGSVVSILDALSDRSLVNYFDDQVWRGYVNQPATAAIRLSASHEAAGTGAGIVAIIDTGIDPNHPVLAGSLVPGYDFIHDTAGTASEWTDLDGSVVSILDGSVVSILDGSAVLLNGSTVAILDQTTATELSTTVLPRAFGHGTMVAGLVHLVAPTARIMPLKAFRADGTSTVFDVVRAIYYAVDNGARVINMSFSATAASSEITRAINFATSRGVICVASAGNLGEETLVYPGALRNVLGVGSTSSTNPPTRSSFSNYGDALVSVGAPGEAVITTYPGGHYAGAWGTSFSTPLAAGGVALLLQVDPTLDQAKAANVLGKAEPMPGGMGNGRLNLSEAMQTVSDTTAPTVALITPATGGAIFGSVLVSASASDNVRVAGVKFLLNDNPLGAESTTAPFELTWTTAAVPNGSHALTAIARDGAGNQSSSTINVTVSNDTAPPTVALTSPSAGATLSGTVTVMATASDDLEVFGVRFTLDGAPLGAEDTVAPYEATWTTPSGANGPHTIAAIARDAAGHEATVSAVVTVVNDLAAPTVAITSPASGATLSGIVTARVTASDDVGVVGVQLTIDGTPMGAEDTAPPYELLWNTAGTANGTHTVTAVARDSAGRATTASAVVTVANDSTPPAVSLDTPAQGTTVAGLVALLATASDEVGVVGVRFEVDGVLVAAEDTVAPHEVLWNTEGAANGVHTVTAVARDAAGHTTTASASVIVVNDTTEPTLAVTSPATGATVGGSVTLAVTASDDVGVVSVLFLVDGTSLGAVDSPPYSMTWMTVGASNGAHTLTAVARDSAGNQATAASVNVIVANDTAAPTVALTSPATGATLSGVATLLATASDDVGVVGVQFKVDGALVGTEDTAAPYEVLWNTAGAANGVHTVTAVARDAAGRETAASAEVTVSNDTAAPTVALTSPTAGATLSGVATLSATASDDVGIVGVEFKIDGALIGADTIAPYEAPWNTTDAADGPHTVTAVARDAAGRETAASVELIVLNAPPPPPLP